MPHAASDRNLLFGILALQMDCTTRDGLIDGLQAWTQDKTRSIGEILVHRKHMLPEQRDVLEQLVDAHIAQHGGDPQQSLQELSSVAVAAFDLRSIEDPDVQASLQTLDAPQERNAGKLSSADTAEEYHPEGTTLLEPQRPDLPELRFQVLRPHAEGGLGRVSIAVDREFNREVAFKEIKSQHQTNKDAQHRFVLEAEVTGGLEHPGIVPVYGLGHFQDGRPFYAMRFVRGDSLKTAILAFHRRRGAEGHGASHPAYAHDVQFRELISRFIDVCFAMEYAHSRGVLHRDLKPGNIMLGKYGETLVVDWGLAKAMAGAEGTADPTEDLDQETPLVPGLSEDVAATQMGRALGTPQFMSPEQAAGRLDELGPTTDVYSLGATLYQVLTGDVPIGASATGSHSDRLSILEILKRVQTGQFPGPRTVNRDVPAGLEAICLKAMSRVPQDRYPSARALVADLKAWMADEPVNAWSEPLSMRARRWVRGHQVVVGIALTALLVLATVSPMFTLQQSQYAAQESRLRQNAEQAQQTAESERQTAKSAQMAERQQRQKAVAARGAERTQRIQAEKNAYNSDMLLIQRDWETASLAHLRELLERHRDREDLQGFEWSYWNRLAHTELSTLTGHIAPVNCVSFSSDGTRLASASSDNTVKVWDAFTGQETLTFTGHTGPVTSVSFSPDKNLLASASYDKTVKVWNTTTGQETLALKGHTGFVTSVSFSPDGKRLASAGGDRTVKVWETATGQETVTLKGHTNWVNSVSFSPDGKRLASAGNDNTIRVWDISTGQETLILSGHTNRVRSVSFSPDGKQLASASGDWTVKVWDTVSGQETHSLKGHTGPVTSVSFSPDGTRLASAGFDNTVKVWAPFTGRETLTIKGHTGHIEHVSFSPNGSRLATASQDRTVRLWNLTASQEAITLNGHTGYVRSVSFSPDGSQLASASFDRTVRMWDADTGQETHTLPGHTDTVYSVSFSPDGTRLASANHVWNAPTGQETLSLNGHTGYVRSVSFSPNGKQLASASQDGTVKLWNADNGQETLTLTGHPNWVNSVSFSPDGKRLASAGNDNTIKVWDTTTGHETLTLKGHTNWVRGVSFSPDGQWLASAGFDKTVRIWDTSTGQEERTLKGHTSFVNCVSFSPDGTRLASAGFDRTVRIWDTSTGQETLTLKGHSNLVNSVSFSPDGTRLASAGEDGTVRVWDSRPWTPELRAQSQARGLLTVKRDQVKSLDELCATIRADPTLSEMVRKQALEWSALFWKNRRDRDRNLMPPPESRPRK